MWMIILPVAGQTIRGIVSDKQTGLPVPDFSITDEESHLSAVTDRQGVFELRLKPESSVALTCSHLAYKPFCITLDRLQRDTLLCLRVETKVMLLDDVSVTAPLFRQVLTKTYSQTNIDGLAIEEKIAATLIDVLEEVPGITKRSEYHSPIALRGLGGKRLLITEDGNRRMGNFSGGFMGQNVNIYDLSKVEVIKGPASVRYGPGAITGIINMQSKAPFSRPGWHGRVLTSYGLNNHEKTVLGSVNWADMDHAVSLSARWRDADDYMAGQQMKNTSYRDKDARVSYTWEGDHYFSVRAESELHVGGPWGRPAGFNGTEQMLVYNRHDDSWHNALTLTWQPDGMIGSMEGAFYFDKEYRQQIKDSYDIGSGKLSYREDVRYSNYDGGWRYASMFSLAECVKLTLGSDGVFYRIASPTEYTDYFLSSTIRNRVSKNAGIFLAGAFAESTYRSDNGRLKFSAGLRTDYSRVNEGDVHDTLQVAGRAKDVYSWNGTAGIVYEARRNLFLSLQLARSCRMPDASEMFMTGSGTDGVVYGNPELSPEYGLNLDAGIRGELGALFFDLSLFSNFFHDFISMEYWADSGKRGINYTYYNIDRARILGGEFSAGFRWSAFLHPDNTLSYNGMFVYTRGDKLTDDPGWFSSGIPLRNIPPFNFNQNITLRRLLSSAASFYLSGDIRFYATQHRIASESDGGYVSPAYVLFGASAGYLRKSRFCDWELRLRGDNLTDNQYRPFESLVYAMGRNVKVMLTVKF